MLLNIGYVEALKLERPFDCFFFHDVDMLPEDERLSYACPQIGYPQLMSAFIDDFDYSFDYSFISKCK